MALAHVLLRDLLGFSYSNIFPIVGSYVVSGFHKTVENIGFFFKARNC